MQLDLFKAELVIFPADRSADVRRMAGFLSVVDGPEADAYYRKACRKLASRLRACGATDGRIRREVQAFQIAVQHELIALVAINRNFEASA
ncbi:DUF6074 family protein [Aureimonas altamirensis]|uniref:DUF6074 family protein n=1 Tax=Aureimonas altamirensis TaxID=370622 RepID=UPI001E613E8B|nr:DUF6074 family protein [Aureimonas altamirensis]UHD45525.1 DUF6074 family protein [Aureimonas altamirensis]